MKVSALVPYHPGFCSGQRFRIELWARHLAGRGVEVELLPFTTERLTDVLYRPGRRAAKAYRMLRCFADQLGRVVRASRPDVAYLYREAALIGPPLVERLARRWKVPVVYDIDEPLFVPYVSPNNAGFGALRWLGKVDELFRTSDHVMAVDRPIAEYAARLNPRVSVVPMAVDTGRYAPPPAGPPAGRLRVGWTGTHTTQPNLNVIAAPLARLASETGAGLRVIGDRPMTLPGVDLDFHPWSPECEVPLLQGCEIGVVPVRDEPWNPWKFFFKLIQMMSLGMAVVATPVGSNLEIIEDGVNGFFAATEAEWFERLRALARDPELRRRVGRAARETAVARFDLLRQIDQVEAILRDPTAAGTFPVTPSPSPGVVRSEAVHGEPLVYEGG